MKQSFFEYMKSSIDTHSKGASARKLTAWSINFCVVLIHLAYIKTAFSSNDFSRMESILTLDYVFIGGLLGMTTYENIKQSKNKSEEKISEDINKSNEEISKNENPA